MIHAKKCNVSGSTHFAMCLDTKLFGVGGIKGSFTHVLERGKPFNRNEVSDVHCSDARIDSYRCQLHISCV